MEVREILISARDLILHRGWGQGGYHKLDENSVKCNFCAAGAIKHFTYPGGYDARIAACTALARAIGLPLETPSGPLTYEGAITRWNDLRVRKKEEVISAFNEAIRHTYKSGE